VLLPQPGWQHAAAAILVLPLLALVLLSVPAWITWPLLSTERRTTVLEFVDRIVEIAKALTKSGWSSARSVHHRCCASPAQDTCARPASTIG